MYLVEPLLWHHLFTQFFKGMSAVKMKSDPVKTVLVITVGMLVVYMFTKWQWALYVSLIIGILGVFSSFMAGKIEWVWMKLTWVLSKIIPNVLLSAIFYLFLTPIALLSRIFGEKDQLGLKNDKDSMFKKHKKTFDPESFEKTW